MISRTSSFNRNPHLVRRPSINSRLSFAVSIEHEETAETPAPAEVEEEIAEIKRYEVRDMTVMTLPDLC